LLLLVALAAAAATAGHSSPNQPSWPRRRRSLSLRRRSFYSTSLERGSGQAQMRVSALGIQLGQLAVAFSTIVGRLRPLPSPLATIAGPSLSLARAGFER